MRAFSFLLSPILLATIASVASAHNDRPTHATTLFRPSEDARLERRSPPAGIYVCSGPNWTGTCAWHAVTDMGCTEFTWNPHISFGPPNGWQCKFYAGDQCTSAMTNGHLTFPGTTNLASLYGSKTPATFKCRQCPSDPGCINNNAPSFDEALTKFGEKGANGKCQYYSMGNVYTRVC